MIHTTSSNKKEMPDIARSKQEDLDASLDRVGMTEVQVPLLMSLDGESYRLAAKADLFVNLTKQEARGIHMSRLFLKAQEKFEKNTFSIELIKDLLTDFLDSHEDLSDEAFVRLKFDFLSLRQALLSDYAGWRSYPVVVEAKKSDVGYEFFLNLEVLYSSTCPCSAALSRQLIQDHFEKSFSDSEISKEDIKKWLGESANIVATPHSQRSELKVKLKLDANIKDFSIAKYLDLLENTLSTPVQTAVKREDEQEFARLNAANLMFCEDAARKVHKCLDSESDLLDFWIRVNHKESLHPHNAVSVATKGVEDGFKAD